MQDKKLIVFAPSAARPAPIGETGIVYWVKSRLLNGPFNTALTVASIFILFQFLPSLINWGIVNAVWSGNSEDCKQPGTGACWAFVGAKARIMFVGVYPAAEIWRPAIGGIVLLVLAIASMAGRLNGKLLIGCWLALPVFGFWLIGGGSGLASVDQSQWGGLMLSLLLAIVGIIFSIPLGILLALGRYNGTPMIKAICVSFIELIRGVPLITILFMATVMMPLLLPPDLVINNMLRIQIGIILFSAAYIAEVVRGGLQALPKGQTEAAKAIGLSSLHTTWFVVLPQALRHVLPPLIGRCIALFKDTSLVIIVGLLDFLGMLKSSSLDALWLGYETEAYVFGAFIYWVICYSLSRYGRLLESQGPVSNT